VIETKTFILGGNATFTVTSRKSGVRFTFKVRQPSPDMPHFVKLLNGADNENSFEFFGTIFGAETFRHSRKARITPDAPSAKAFDWLWRNINNPAQLAQVDIHHEGKCCCCGRKLTVPASIELGVGPECAAKLGY
jgi:hypothetical protein